MFGSKAGLVTFDLHERSNPYRPHTLPTKESAMFNEYTHAAHALIGEIRQLSPAAADCIEQIRAKYGEYSASLSAVALIVYREGLTRPRYSSSPEDLNRFIYYEEMREIPEAFQLYEEAAAHLMTRANWLTGWIGIINFD